MPRALFAALTAALAVKGSAMADTSPGEDAYNVVAQYDPPLLRAQFLPAAVGEMTSRSVMDMFLGRRQTCDPGYRYCSYGYCMVSGRTCCPHVSCPAGETCCGYNKCHPIGTQCCKDEGFCPPGNICVKFPDISYDVCCTDTSCTAYVTGGVTVTRTTTAPVETATQVVYAYYYFYITWTYYVYYWYYIVAEGASVVTSSLTATTTTLSVRASDSAAASSSFDKVSATFSQYTPPSATSLESLAGSTFSQYTPPSAMSLESLADSTFTGAGGPGPTGTPTTTGLNVGGGAGSMTSPTGPTGIFGGGSSGASRVGPWADYFVLCFFSSAAVVGVLMVTL